MEEFGYGGERVDVSTFLTLQTEFGGGSVMVWGAISCSGSAQLLTVSSSLTVPCPSFI